MWLNYNEVNKEGYYIMSKNKDLFKAEIVLVKFLVNDKDNVIDMNTMILYDKDDFSDNINEFKEEKFFGPIPQYKR